MKAIFQIANAGYLMQNYVFILKPTRIYLRKLLQKSEESA